MNVATERKIAKLRGNLMRQTACIAETEGDIYKVKNNPDHAKYRGVLVKLTTKLARQLENRDDTLCMIEAFEHNPDDVHNVGTLPKTQEINEAMDAATTTPLTKATGSRTRR